jgi:hypothetical protein
LDIHHDFLNDEPPPANFFQFIMTNPPFCKKKLFLFKAIEYGKPFAMLLPIDVLFQAQVGDHLANIPMKVMIPTHAMKFLRNGEFKNYGACVWLLGNFPRMNGLTFTFFDNCVEE